MIRVIVSGAMGRMGKMIGGLVQAAGDMEFVAGIEREEVVKSVKTWNNTDIPLYSSLEDVIEKGDVIIEFTNPETTITHVEIAKKYKKPMVIGTTGLTDDEKKIVEDAATSAPIVLSPNMSTGVNILFKLVEEVARILGEEYDTEIIEIHHHHKKDAPSGTAKKLGEIIAGVWGKKLDDIGVYGRSGFVGERKKGELGIMAVRAGDVVGDHTVIFAGPGERLELTHRAHSREAFANGALTAARFVIKQKPGLYSTKEVLGL